ncbi:hypothetical protein CBS101457_000897 [Exobasidium rhododendri]|nr:hypothetical protein CBS101457_000897 [Exobasidium rhododendri]
MSISASAIVRTSALASPALSSSSSSSPFKGSSSKKRANDLLRNYYGLGDLASASPTARLDPDSSVGFDAQAAFQAMLQEKTLTQLLKSESDLLTEIRELDGERQSLVYNHHHELVSATETIGKMKEKADALTPSLTSLRSSLRDISQSLQEIQEPVKATRLGPSLEASTDTTEIEKIVSLAVELPGRLKDTIILEGEVKGLEKARGLWGSMEAVLATWDEAGIPGAKDIINDCRHVLREAQQRK